MLRTAMLVEGSGIACEDRAEVIDVGGTLILVVADGAEGISGAAAAAEKAVAGVRHASQSIADAGDPAGWAELLQHLDAVLDADAEAGETTLVVAAVTPERIAGAAAGDSGAWLIGSEHVCDLTEYQIRKPLLGSGDCTALPYSVGWEDGTLVLASDGLLKYATEEAIAFTVRSHDPEVAVRKLLDQVRLRSGAISDDVAIIVCSRSGSAS